MKKFVFLISVLTVYISGSYAQDLKISLHNNENIETVVVSVAKGKYRFIGDNSAYSEYKRNNIFHISKITGKIEVRDKKKRIGQFREIRFEGLTGEDIIRVKPTLPAKESRLYDDDLEISVSDNRIHMVNKIDMEKYIAGVIEAEGGSNAEMEYYKAQAVLVRTYTIKNMYRHAEDGYNLCDQVHCQAYKGKSEMNNLIYKATAETAGLVIVDRDTNLIMSPFHSNCGGMTSDAQTAWQKPLPYLISMKDPFCTAGKNAQWQKLISFKGWQNYVRNKGVNIDEFKSIDDYLFTQPARKKYYELGNTRILLKEIRKDWELKSTYFDIEKKDDQLLFRGHGYGHGVGLCQEGAMEMAKVGFTWKDIIHFYFHNIKIVDYRNLDLRRY